MESSFVNYWQWWSILFLFIAWVLFRHYSPKADIKWKTLDADLQWDTQSDAAINKIYDYVIGFSDSTILWYQSRRRPKRVWGVCLRVGALFATAAAGLIPLSNDLGIGIGKINDVWSTVLIAAAGILVSVDALGGFTSGWVRYMLAQQKVERLRDTFFMDWNALKISKTGAQGMLERAKTFLLTVGKVVDDETQEWATEFQNAIKEMEKARKIAAETEKTGAIEVSVENPEDVAGGWTLEIDGSQRGQTSSKSLAVTDVFVGIRKLKVYGKDSQGKTLSDEKTIKVEGGATVAKELKLS